MHVYLKSEILAILVFIPAGCACPCLGCLGWQGEVGIFICPVRKAALVTYMVDRSRLILARIDFEISTISYIAQGCSRSSLITSWPHRSILHRSRPGSFANYLYMAFHATRKRLRAGKLALPAFNS